MKHMITPSQREFLNDELTKRGFSRRSFGRFAALISAGAALPFYNEPALAQLSAVRDMPPDAIKINANENPMGPCPEAAEAMHSLISKGGRYMYEETFGLEKTLADQEGVKPNYVHAYGGSSLPLHNGVMAFCSKDKPFVIADPGYEAGMRAAKFIGAKVIMVPLRKDNYAHDVKAMAAASSSTGLIYLCNPNNPTGSITPRADIEWLIANKPAGSVLMLDEAYIHLSHEQYGTDLVAQEKDVIVLRTFSKLYGMAGLRAGAAIARPDLLDKMRPYSDGAWPITGMIGANVSLKTKGLVTERRMKIQNVREDTLAFLDKKGYKYVPSVSNKFMVDVRMPGADFAKKMAEQKVYVGRVWPSWPTYVRVSVGLPDEMAAFKKAFTTVMG
jgi:histidinol-phosphate/aromatic aminotransferase/cobyric acid decarboxylase-like protein